MVGDVLREGMCILAQSGISGDRYSAYRGWLPCKERREGLVLNSVPTLLKNVLSKSDLIHVSRFKVMS
jgi:hypothetical protein